MDAATQLTPEYAIKSSGKLRQLSHYFHDFIVLISEMLVVNLSHSTFVIDRGRRT